MISTGAHPKKILFETYQLKSLQLKNKIVMAPMTRCQSPSHLVGDKDCEYYTKRAQGGVGLIITEGLPINDEAHGYKSVPSFYQESVQGWQKIIERVHQEDCKIFPQLWHVGSMRQSGLGPNPRAQCLAPSAIKHPYFETLKDASSYHQPKEMTVDDIKRTIRDFARAALVAKDLGFDGLELHGAHSYLIDQFFWSKTNKRTDQYGGKTLAQRTRFAVELLDAVRHTVGPGFPISFRLSLWKMGDFAAKEVDTPEELKNFLTPLVNSGVDIFHCSSHKFSDPLFECSDLSFAAWVKTLSACPSISVGAVGLHNSFLESFFHKTSKTQPLDCVLSSLEKKQFDLVALGRPLLSDPFWVSKLKQDKEHEIIPFDPKDLPYKKQKK